jgi:GNAT superfamily N-acetyltransferase
MTLLIRDFRDEDTEQVLALVRELQVYEMALFDRMKDPAEIDADYLDALRNARTAERGQLLVAERDGSLLGYAYVVTGLSSAGERDEVPYRYASVLDLVVTERERGQGIGTRLLAACEEIARAAGLRWLRIAHLADNVGAARSYRRFGFRNLLVEMEKVLD